MDYACNVGANFNNSREIIYKTVNGVVPDGLQMKIHEGEGYNRFYSQLQFIKGTMKRHGLLEIIDQQLKRNRPQQVLSWGWMSTFWPAHNLAESNHHKLPVRTWVRKADEPLYIPPLTPLLIRILEPVGLPPDVYIQLKENLEKLFSFQRMDRHMPGIKIFSPNGLGKLEISVIIFLNLTFH